MATAVPVRVRGPKEEMNEDLIADIMLLIVFFWICGGVLYCLAKLIGLVR